MKILVAPISDCGRLLTWIARHSTLCYDCEIISLNSSTAFAVDSPRRFSLFPTYLRAVRKMVLPHKISESLDIVVNQFVCITYQGIRAVGNRSNVEGGFREIAGNARASSRFLDPRQQPKNISTTNIQNPFLPAFALRCIALALPTFSTYVYLTKLPPAPKNNHKCETPT